MKEFRLPSPSLSSDLLRYLWASHKTNRRFTVSLLQQSPPAHHHLQHHPHQRVPHTPSPSSPVKRPWSTTPTSPNGNSSEPPPLPKRNQNMQKRPKEHHRHFNTVPAAGGSRSHHRGGGSTPASPLDEDDINANRATPLASRRRNTAQRSDATPPGESIPPPLPPRTGLPPPHGLDPDACNSINKQMSYPLVATFATLVNDYVSSARDTTVRRIWNAGLEGVQQNGWKQERACLLN